MKIKVFCGVDIAAMKKLLKSDKKRKDAGRIGWQEIDGHTYYCNGYIIVRFADVPFRVVAEVFDLSCTDAPKEPAGASYKDIFDRFKASDYEPATVTAWKKETKTGDSRIVVGNGVYCELDEALLSPFSPGQIKIRDKLAGVMVDNGDDMTAYILPRRPSAEDDVVAAAIRGDVAQW